MSQTPAFNKKNPERKEMKSLLETTVFWVEPDAFKSNQLNILININFNFKS